MLLACVCIPLGRLKHLVGRLSCGNEGLLCAVLCGAYVGCCAPVGNGGWNGAVEDSLLDLVAERVTFGDVVDHLVWG